MPSIRPALTAAAVAALLAVSATTCGPTDDTADDKPSASATTSGTGGRGAIPPLRPSFDDYAYQQYGCTDAPVRLKLTAGSSGGGWFAKKPDGTTALVSNASIGPANGHAWLAAAPRLSGQVPVRQGPQLLGRALRRRRRPAPWKAPCGGRAFAVRGAVSAGRPARTAPGRRPARHGHAP